jgi:hypothetical protein
MTTRFGSLTANMTVEEIIAAAGGGGGGSIPAYSLTNVVTDRILNADSVTIDEVADVLGTLITDIAAGGVGGGGGSGGSTQALAETRAAAVSSTIDVSVKSLRTAGYALPGDGGDALYKRVNAQPAHSGYFRSLDRFLADGTTNSTNGGYWEIVVPAEGIAIECFGAVADDVTDVLPALIAAESCVTSTFNPAFTEYKGGPKILFGYGRGANGMLPYRLSAPYTPGRTVHLKGASAGGALANSGNATLIRVAAGQKAIVLRDWVGTTPGATGSVFEDLNFQSQGYGGQTSAHGFDANTQFIMRNCEFSGFGGNGSHIDAAVPDGNANIWKMEHCKFYRNAGDGLYVNGPDANAGVSIGLDFGQNLGWAINDSCFLGNTHIAAHSAGNGLGAYKSDDPNSATIFLGCYSESEVSSLTFPAMMIGGNAGAGLSGNGFKIWGNVLSGFRSIHNSDNAGFTLNIHTTENEIFKLGTDPNSGAQYQTFLFSPSYNDYVWSGSGYDTFHLTRSNTSLTGGRGASLRQGAFVFWDGFWVGQGSVDGQSHRFMGNSLAAPTTGTYARGDVFWNREPAAAGNLAGGTGSAGWICTAGGSPGTWIAFGHVPANSSVVYDPPSLATGAVSPIQTININGLPAGSYVQASFSNDLQGLTLKAWTIADNVKFQFENPTAGTVDLASGTVRVRVTSHA